MTKKLWIIGVIVVIVAVWWLWNSKWGGNRFVPEGALPAVPAVSEEDTTTAIRQDLEQLDLGDINEQFEQIDAELNNL